jgi:uncharacterized phage protein gp47/JayE
MPFGVTGTGFVIETEQEILDRLAATARSTISPSLDVSQNSAIGRLLAIIASEITQNQELAQSVWNAFSDLADGQSLDNRAALTGTTRNPATYSTVTATVNMAASTSVSAGEIIASVSGNPDALFANVSAFTSAASPDPDDNALLFQALDTGPVQAPSGTLTVLEVSISGVNSITNALDADPGEDQESDAALRIRRREELTAQGTGTQESIRADVDRVTDVEFAECLTNRTDYTADGLPPHSFEVVVFGGTDDDVAQAIWDGMPSGIAAVGSSSGTATDDGGNSQTVKFTRPTELRILVEVDLTVDPDLYGGDAAVASAIANFSTGVLEITQPNGTVLTGELGVGSDVIRSKLYSAIDTVSGILDITDVRLAISPATPTAANITVTDREIVAVSGTAGIQTADITVSS